jgi:Zn-dependent protease
MSSAWVVERIEYFILLVLSLTVHEWAHAWSAYKLGDDTAKRMGRLTLDPLAHMDPVGTLLLPLVLPILTHTRFAFGWAKPVPINPANFRRGVNMSAGAAITAAAGPLSNLVLAIICAVLYGLLWRLGILFEQPAIEALLGGGMLINVGLAIFNLLPIPPLDGSRIVEHFIPYKNRPTWEAFQRLSPILLMAVFFGGGFLLSGPIRAVQGVLAKLIQSIAAA